LSDLEERLDGGILRLTLNRPDALNALTAGMSNRLTEAFEGSRRRDEVRVVVLTGAGGAFSAGADIGGGPETFDDSTMDRANRLIRAICSLDKPVLSAVRGVAAGYGCALALASDLVVAHESASFLLVFARIGLMPDGGTSATVAASIGRARAMRMALLAEPLSAQEAYDAGLVSHLAGDDFDVLVDKLARRLEAGPPLAFAATKQAVNTATLGHLEDALAREKRGQDVLLRTADTAEGIRAFAERRRPVFRGQ